MFKINANPTFDAVVKIVGQGREQSLALTFRHKTRTQYGDLLQALAAETIDPADALLQLIEKWDADAELNRESIKLLQDHQPGVDWAIIEAYSEAIKVVRKGN